MPPPQDLTPFAEHTILKKEFPHANLVQTSSGCECLCHQHGLGRIGGGRVPAGDDRACRSLPGRPSSYFSGIGLDRGRTRSRHPADAGNSRLAGGPDLPRPGRLRAGRLRHLGYLLLYFPDSDERLACVPAGLGRALSDPPALVGTGAGACPDLLVVDSGWRAGRL